MSEHEVWNELGNLYILSGSYDQAILAYKKAIAINSQAGEPCNNLAHVYMQMGRYVDAAELYCKSADLLQTDQQRATALYKLGDAHFRLREYAQAMDAYQKAEELVPDVQKLIDESKPYDLLIHSGLMNPPLSEVVSESVDETSNDSSSGMELLPFIEELTPWWFDDQTPPEDEPENEYALRAIAEPGVADPGGNIIFTEPLKWDLTPARQPTADPATLTETVLASTGLNEDLTGLLEMMHTYTQDEAGNRNQPAAAEVREASTMITVAEPEAAHVMVVTDAPEVITETPEFSMQTITSLDAVQYETPVELPVVELSAEERAGIQADIQKLKRTLEINPRNPVVWDTLGENHKALGQYEDAIYAYRRAVSLDSSKAFYFHHLGLVFAAAGNIEDAIAAFERVIEIDPNHSLAHATLGGYYRKNGKEELAQAHIVKARSLLANDENEYNRACMEAICGNTDQALELLEIALKNKQNYVNWARKDPDLDFIRNDPRFHALLAEYALKSHS